MSFPRLLQLAGFVFVTYVMVRSLMISDMLFQFGGLILGGLIFFIGRTMEKRQPR
ncbi:MAG: hypothetical protein ACI9EF_000845 [Pseudohongiellaceae bacterium]|jgi:hypothetical protein